MKNRTLLVVASVVLAAGNAFAADATELWAKNCASCHGKDGAGNTMMGKKYGVKDYTDAKVQADLTDQKMADAITNGVVVDGKPVMKPFKEKLAPEEVTALISEIRKFKK